MTSLLHIERNEIKLSVSRPFPIQLASNPLSISENQTYRVLSR